MDTVVIIAVGAAVGIGLFIASRRQQEKNADLWSLIEPALRSGPLSLPDLVSALGMRGLSARGKVALALNERVTQGALDVLEAPAGTPQLEKVKLIKYRLKASA